MADTSKVDAGLLAYLAADTTLAGLAPGGIFFDVAPPGAVGFVVINQQAHQDVPMFHGVAYEQITYLVKAVFRDTSRQASTAAAERIHVLLEDQLFAVTGYTLTNCHRVERVHITEPDVDPQYRWQHEGGLYDVWASPN